MVGSVKSVQTHTWIKNEIQDGIVCQCACAGIAHRLDAILALRVHCRTEEVMNVAVTAEHILLRRSPRRSSSKMVTHINPKLAR